MEMFIFVGSVKIKAEQQKNLDKVNEYVEKFENAMEDDFNTADAVSAIFEIVKLANQTADSSVSAEYIKTVRDTIIKLSDVLGIIAEKEEEMLDEDIEKLIEERQQARKDKNFARADEIRNLLQDKGILLEDTREGVKWKRA